MEEVWSGPKTAKYSNWPGSCILTCILIFYRIQRIPLKRAGLAKEVSA